MPITLRRVVCASWLIASGANPLEVCRWMGHASIQTTFGLYGHLFPDYVDDLADRLGTQTTNVLPLPQADDA